MVEKAHNLKTSQAKRSEYGECAKFVNFSSTDDDGNETNGKVRVTMNENAIEKARNLAGYNLLITSELNMPATKIYNIYHSLWRIEESFRMLKSELDARPVFLQKEDSIKGHFLICYLAVVLVRLLQVKILKDAFGYEEIFNFMKDFKVCKISPYKYMNLTISSDFIEKFRKLTDLPISQFLTNTEIEKMLNHRF